MRQSAHSPAAVAPNRQMLRRILVLMGVFGIGAMALLLVRLFELQILRHEEFESLAVRQQLREVPTAISRGTIRDTNGELLAVSMPVENVYLSPAEIE